MREEGTPRTTPDIVVHDEDPVDDRCETANVGHGSPVGVRKRPDLGREGDECSVRQSRPELLEEGEEICRVRPGHRVVACSLHTGVFPINVNPVEVVRVVRGEDVLDKRLPGRGARADGGEVGRTGPPANGELDTLPSRMSEGDQTSEQVGRVVLREFEAIRRRREGECEVDDVEFGVVDILGGEVPARPVGIVTVHQRSRERGGGGALSGSRGR
jgi:hypothetical protein